MGHAGRGVALLGLLLAIASNGSAQYIRCEAESYYDHHDNPSCGPEIQVSPCEGASGGLAVDYMSCRGEWIRLELALSFPYAFQLGMRSAASEGFVRNYYAQIRNVDEGYVVVAADTLVTQPAPPFG